MIFPDVECTTCPLGECGCGHEERALRRIAAGDYPYGLHGSMTPEQREWCIDEADRAGEGAYRREELAAMDNRELARTVLSAWWNYVRSNCL